jgi:GH25 family lysozyme M1 (1,4-beta-N-acetylmuramidase)
MKRAISLVLTVGILITCMLTLGSVSAFAAETGYDRGYERTMGGSGKVVTKGLDVSEWQGALSKVGTINFADVKKAGYSYVILRAGVKLNAGSNRIDENFEEFYTAAKKAGLDVGAYYYSQAKSVIEAKEEANCFLEYVKGKKFEYPLYMDYENKAAKEAIGSNAQTAKTICYAFMDTLANAGYLVGLYGYGAWFDDQYGGWMADVLNNDIGKKYEFWMANYYGEENLTDANGKVQTDENGKPIKKPNSGKPENEKSVNFPTKYGMYQFTSVCRIDGYETNLDANVSYKDYPAIVKKYGFNGYGASGSVETEKQTEKQTQKPTQKPTQNQTQKLTEAASESGTYFESMSESLGGTAQTDNGCGASIGTVAVLLTTACAGGALIFTKKKKRH